MKKSGREIARLSIIVTVFSLGELLSFSPTALADASQFIPRIYRYGGDLQIDMAYERDANVTPTGGFRTTDTTLEQRLRLWAGGYIYHPRFIAFDGFVGAGLRQEKFESNTETNSPWSTGTANEYGLRVKILPLHRYSLELWTERHVPLVTGRFTPSYQPVFYEKGALFRYKKRPGSLILSTVENTSEYGTSTVDSVSHTADGTYGIGPFTNTAGYRHADSVSTPSQARVAQTFTYFDNSLYFRGANFSSHIGLNKLAQETPLSASSLTDDTLTWREQASLGLPWNFQTAGAYCFESDMLTMGDGASADGSTFARETTSTDLTVGHRLYNSLTTNYLVNNVNNQSTAGDMSTHAQSVIGTYSKMIPWGRLTTGIFFRWAETDIKNAPFITNEVHGITVPVPGFFDLNAQNVDENSITLWVKNPNPPNDLILLTTADYTVTPSGNTFRITIVNLPAPLLFSGPYEFHVKYSIIKEEVDYKTTNMGYNVKLDLFNNLLTPYFGYTKTEQKLLAGSLPGGPQNSEQEIVGLIVAKAPYTFTEEYQSLMSNVNPYRTLRSMADYRKNIGANANVNARLYYITTSYGGGTGRISAYSDNTFGADASLYKSVPRQNLGYNLLVSYAHTRSFSVSDAYILNATLLWKIGSLVITLAATMNESVTEVPSGKNTVFTERYLLSVSRRLF